MKNETDNSKQFIITAFIQLLENTDYEELSVTQIAKKAGVGRATFYRHFKNKEDILKEYFNQQKEKFISDNIYKPRAKEDFKENCLKAFTNLKNHKAFMQSIIKSHLEYLYRDFVNSEFVKNFEKNYPKESLYAAYYAAGSFMNVSIEWVKSGCKESPEEIVEIYINQVFASVP